MYVPYIGTIAYRYCKYVYICFVLTVMALTLLIDAGTSFRTCHKYECWLGLCCGILLHLYDMYVLSHNKFDQLQPGL